jgi:hypothetical protein
LEDLQSNSALANNGVKKLTKNFHISLKERNSWVCR